MVFKNPDILFALFALLIPTLIHLFQFRRYKTLWFSNVSALQNLKKQSRKSRELKKILVLISRLLALTALIFAFAEPEIPAQKNQDDNQLAIYLDNSLSMQIAHQNLNLLAIAKQDLLAHIPHQKTFTLYTNSSVYKELTSEKLEDVLEKIKPTEESLSPKSIYLKLQNNIDKNQGSISLIYMSDFLNIENPEDLKPPSKEISTYYYQPELNQIHNLSIEDAQLKPDNELEVKLHSNLNQAQGSLSLLSRNKLVGKLDVAFKNETEKKLTFKVTATDLENAELRLSQDQLAYDNTFYLHQNKKNKKRILAISEEKANFIQRIFKDTSAYNLNLKKPKQVELIDIQKADLIISNALSMIPTNLKSNLDQALANQQNLVIIPKDGQAAQQKYLNLRLNGFKLFESSIEQKQKITEIRFKHPLFENVFTEEIKNFDYPKTSKNYKITSSFHSVLAYANKSSFLAQRDNLFVFAADLDKTNSNFIQSPLIVPTLIQISNFNNQNQDLYYFSGAQNDVKFETQIAKDQTLKLKKDKHEYIPEQRNFGQSLVLNLASIQLEAGQYALMHTKDTIAQMSFNTARDESHFELENAEKISASLTENSLEEIFKSYNAAYNAIALWKWMLIFAVICFLAEILLIRFLK
ncbi:MAG: BatA domain-containing protein [Psychroflexus sp.]|nr:BatA domain-containing protein [Psychroflexus sp.]MDN6309539.1 BatA domain-containing protein [Psychroflexus sp.]